MINKQIQDDRISILLFYVFIRLMVGTDDYSQL
jgi:hypothetical protein